MARTRLLLLLAAMVAVLGSRGSYLAAGGTDSEISVTFNKDVLPVLQRNCQVCHRPGDIAPMAFTSYESVRPWAKAIKTAVLDRQMPPWFADPHVGEFRNAPKITESDIKTLVAWADGGAPEGLASDRPAPMQWNEGWRIQPDVVISMPKAFQVSAQGTGEIREFLIPNPFKEDTWVTSIEVRPGAPSVVHHVIVQSVDQAREQQLRSALGSAGAAINALAQRTSGTPRSESIYSLNNPTALFSRLKELKTGEGAFTTMETVYAPGTSPVDFRYTDSAKLIRGGGQIRLEVHYTPNGTATLDQTKVGFTLAKEPVKRSFVFMAPEHLVDTRKAIPAGDSNWETSGEITFSQDVELAWFMPHMHLRGKDMTFQLIFPADAEGNNKVQTLLNARFNFNWQLGYELDKPIKAPKGTKLLVTAHHDNSSNNKFNPDAKRDVVWGDLTSEEMMLPWFGVVVDRNAEPGAIATYHPRNLVMDDQLIALDRLNLP